MAAKITPEEEIYRMGRFARGVPNSEDTGDPKKPHEILEEYLRQAYRTDLEEGREAAEAIEVPYNECLNRLFFIIHIRGFAEDLKNIVSFLNEEKANCPDLVETFGRLQESIQHIPRSLDPYEPWFTTMGAAPSWEPDGYVPVAMNYASKVHDGIKWLSLRFPQCADALQKSVTELMEAARKAEEPKKEEGEPEVSLDENGQLIWRPKSRYGLDADGRKQFDTGQAGDEEKQNMIGGFTRKEGPSGENSAATKPQCLSKVAQLAWGEYQQATHKMPSYTSSTSDKDVYEWVLVHSDRLESMPKEDTWKRHLRTARKFYGQQKNTPRAGRTAGSAARRKDME